MITKETIDRIFDAVRVEEVVGDFVQLKKRGVNFIGLCPFHNEKTPSFHVNPDKGLFKCFGCGASGDVIKFVERTESLSFVEAACHKLSNRSSNGGSNSTVQPRGCRRNVSAARRRSPRSTTAAAARRGHFHGIQRANL